MPRDHLKSKKVDVPSRSPKLISVSRADSKEFYPLIGHVNCYLVSQLRHKGNNIGLGLPDVCLGICATSSFGGKEVRKRCWNDQNPCKVLQRLTLGLDRFQASVTGLEKWLKGQNACLDSVKTRV